MASRSPFSGRSGFGGFGGLGGFGPPPRDVLILLGVVFATFSIEALAPDSLRLLRLTSGVWRSGFVWQLVTYPFIGFGPPSLWFLLELLILFWFGRDVRVQLGKRRFWRLLASGALVGALVAVAVTLVLVLATGGVVTLGGGAGDLIAPLMQGQRMLLVLLVAAFATVNSEATILLFFVLPVRAGWFLWIEVLFAFMGFLATRDLAGFLGITAGVVFTYLSLSRRGARRGLRDWRLRLERWWIEQRMARLRRKRGLKVIDGDRGDGRVRKGPWTH